MDLIWRSLAKSKYMEHCEKAKERRKVYESLEAKLSHPGFVPLTEDDARVLRERVNERRKKTAEASAGCVLLSPPLEMYREPVVSPSGNSYERSAIEQYIKQQHEKYGREKKVADPLQRLFDYVGIAASEHRAEEHCPRVFEGASLVLGKILSESEAEDWRGSKENENRNHRSRHDVNLGMYFKHCLGVVG